MKTQIIRFAILALIGLLLSPQVVAHASPPPTNSVVAPPQTAHRNHNVILRVVRVTPDWMPFTSTDGWTQAVTQKESEILLFYEVAIWDETSAVHFYRFPNDYDAFYGHSGNVSDEQKIAYREQFLIKKYTGMPEAWTNERSTFLKSAFMDIVSYIVNQHPNSDHHLIYNGHGGPGGRLFDAQLNNDHAYEFLNFWSTSLGKPLGVIDMGGPCTKGGFADLDNFCESARYYVASDLPNGGYTMDDWTYEKYQETDPETQYHNLFFTNPSLEETLKDRIDLKRKAYEYSRNNMITNQVAQANYLYSCTEFRKFSPDFKSFLSRVRVRYSIFDDLYQYMIDNNAPPTLIEQFNNVIVHKADNKDFFEWSEIRNGILMPDPGLLVLLQPNPDFNGDGTVGISDFLLFAEQFGLSQGDAEYDGRYDLDGDGSIGIGDFLIFVEDFGKKVPSN